MRGDILSFYKIFEQLCDEKGVTPTQAARDVGVAQPVVSQWKKRGSTPKAETVQKLADYFGVTVDYMLKQSNPFLSSNEKLQAYNRKPGKNGLEYERELISVLPPNVTPLPQMKKVPIVGQIACGAPILANQNIEGYAHIPPYIYADFALICKGDSMINMGIVDGDIVYIRQQEEVENGQVAAVMVGDDEATVKRFYYSGDIVQLVAENSNIPPLVYVGEDIRNIRVIGLVVAFAHIFEDTTPPLPPRFRKSKGTATTPPPGGSEGPPEGSKR